GLVGGVASAAVGRAPARVRAGQTVTCALSRTPALLAEMASTLDAASGGRVFLGIGAGWDEREYVDFGYGPTLPPIRERLAQLERTLHVLRARRGARPILVGGAGEKSLLRLVAQYADACNFSDSLDPAFYGHKPDGPRAHCDAGGRDDAEIMKPATFTVRESEDVDFAALARAGIEYFIVYVEPAADLRRLERFAATLDMANV